MQRTEQVGRHGFREGGDPKLFESIGKGFGVVEVVFDDGGVPVDCRFRDTNPTFEALAGRSNGTPGQMEERWTEVCGRVARTGRSESFEQYFPALDRWYEVHAARLGGEDSRAVALVCDDITDHKEAEERSNGRAKQNLQESEERLKRILEISTVGVVFWGSDLTITDANDAFLRMTGLEYEEAVGTSWRELTPEEFHPASERQIERFKEEGRAPPYEKQYYRADGSRLWGLFASQPLEDGESVEFVVDIGERKQAQKRLEELNETLEERVETRTQQVRELSSKLTMAEQRERHRLAQILHDDLQQRLYGIQMGLSVLHQHAEEGEREALMEQARRAEAWTEEAIATTKQLTVDLSPPILENEGLPDALGWLQTQMGELYDLDVHVELDRRAELDLEEDMRVLLFQIVRELLLNVVEHAGVQEAEVTLTGSDDTLVLVVADQGCGFDPEQGLREGAESAFGLTSVQKRIGLFGGEATVHSAPGVGTQVTVRVPLDARGEREPDRRGGRDSIEMNS